MGKEGFTSCICEGISACGERLSACGKSIGKDLNATGEGSGADWEGHNGCTCCMANGVDCPLVIIESGFINKRHMR